MMAFAENELICDFAETYHIYDYQALPVEYAAVLAFGLGDNSRVKMKLWDQKQPIEVILLANVVDYLALLTWFQTEDGRKNRNRPKSMTEIVLGETKEEKEKVIGFDSGEALDKALAQFRKGN